MCKGGSVGKQVKMQILYKTKNWKTAIMEINLEVTMQQVTEKVQDKGGIRLSNGSLTKIDACCHCGNFSLQEFLLEDTSEEIDIFLPSLDEAYINETKVESTEIQEPAFQRTKFQMITTLNRWKMTYYVICGQNSKTWLG